MARTLSQPEHLNVLIGNTAWAWPQAVADIFRPRGIMALVANSSRDMVEIIDKNRIHLTILDSSFDQLSGMQTLRIIRKHDKMVPCILLAQTIDKRLLSEALGLDVFCVMTKPVNLTMLKDQVDRLFRKYYAIGLFPEIDAEPSRFTGVAGKGHQRLWCRWNVKRKGASDKEGLSG